MATKTDKDRGDGKEGYEASVDALTEFQGGRTLDDPEVGPDGQIVVNPYSQQQLDERMEQGDAEGVAADLEDLYENVKSQRHGGRRDEADAVDKYERPEPVKPGDTAAD